MGDISFLPEEQKAKEEELKSAIVESAGFEEAGMHVPVSESEDIEIIEVDASEVGEMLKGEPLYSRLYYKITLWVDGLRTKYTAPRAIEPPPKLPPQFLDASKKIPAPKTAPVAIEPSDLPAPGHMTVQSVQSRTAGRRVRIIRHRRRPVSVSLLDEEMMRRSRIDLSKRRFTLIFLTGLFAVVLGGSYLLLDRLEAQAFEEYQQAQAQQTELQTRIKRQQDAWSAFEDLEPRLLALNTLLDEHQSTLRILRFLETHTLRDVTYSTFSVDANGVVQLDATAPSYAVVARQLLIFEESDAIASFDASSFTLKEEQGSAPIVAFQLRLAFTESARLFLEQTPSE